MNRKIAAWARIAVSRLSITTRPGNRFGSSREGSSHSRRDDPGEAPLAQDHLDDVRALLVNEPRGHADMYGCFVTEPVAEGSDLGVLFFHNAGFSTACGHGTIALATYAIEHGLLPASGTRSTRIHVPSERFR